jgi:hypothetical protein
VKFFGHAEVSSVELPNALEFTIVRVLGWFDWLAWIVLMPTVLWMFWRTHSLLAHAIAIFAGVSTAAYLIANFLQGKETKLRVTSDEILAEGNLGKFFTTTIRIPASEVASLRYFQDAEGNSRGVQVNSKYVLPGVSKEQGESVIRAITRKFPDTYAEDEGIGSFLFGVDSGITTLGLSEDRSGNPTEKS